LIDELAAAGTETQLLALVRRLDRRRVQPSLCLLRGDSAASRALEPADCPVLRLGVGSLRSPATLVRAWRLARFLRRERIDVLQVYFPDSTYFGVPVAWLAGVPAGPCSAGGAPVAPRLERAPRRVLTPPRPRTPAGLAGGCGRLGREG